jgi:hypothetical protein
MQATAPEMDLDFCIEQVKYLSRKIEDHKKLMINALAEKNTILFQKFFNEKISTQKEMYYYIRLIKYFKGLQI